MKSTSREERLMIVGSIVSDRFLRQFVSLSPLALIDNKLLRDILDMCIIYFDEHASAPGNHITDLWSIHKQDLDDDDAKAEMIDKVLDSVLAEYKSSKTQFNVDYALKEAEKYLKLKRLKKVSDDVRAAISHKDPDMAEGVLSKYKPVSLSGGSSSAPTEEGFFQELFEEDEKPLFRLSGILGDLVNGQLFRSGFVCVLGAAKSGKSWLLQELAMVAWWQRCNVAYFIVGDMSARDAKERMASHMTKRPTSRYHKKTKPINLPKVICAKFNSCWRDEKEEGCRCKHMQSEVYTEEETIEPYSHSHVAQADKIWKKRTKGKMLRLDCHPGKSKSVKDIEAILDNWEHFHSFLPDVVVIDYADVLAPIGKRDSLRDEINDTWIMMRALAQKRNCLVITATQADSKSYGKKHLDMGNFSDDRRKNDHVTALYGLTQTASEKKKDIVRVGEILVRHGTFTGRQVSVHRCLSIGRFHMASEWGSSEGEE